MTENGDNNSAKAKAFFDRAAQLTGHRNYDYAIEMYIQGLQCSPEDLEQGHVPLRELALARQSKGGKKPSMMEKLKHGRGKTPLEQMLVAEYLLAKDPNNISYAEAMLKAAIAGQFNRVARWTADLIFRANSAAERPSASVYALLKDSYAAIGDWERALVACREAVQLKPHDQQLADEYQRISAELTVSRGKYDQEGDFRKSIKDREAQEKLQAQEGVVKSENWRLSALSAARQMYDQDNDTPRNIFNLASALADMRTDEAENEAIAVLEEAWQRKHDFSFKERAGQIRIGQLKRKIRYVHSETDATDEAAAGRKLSELSEKLKQVELEHWRLCVDNYPTDLKAKYEYGLRLIRNKRFDEAIPLLQEAQKDPRRRISAMSKVGLAFFLKGWFTDAAEIFTRAIETYEIKDDDTAKELRYNLGRAYEELGKTDDALEIYRKIAQLDFGYKDVPQRVEKLRSRGSKPPPQEGK